MGDPFENFVVVIGAMKGGTTSLHQYMNLHPEIFMSKLKELDFFVEEKRWRRGETWYRRQFAGAGTAQVCGESSPNYTKWPRFPGVPERMVKLLPRARLIYVLRDPVRRTYSHYVHNLSNGRERRDIREAFAEFEGNNYVMSSRYELQLQRFLAHYPRESMLLLTQETLRDDRRAVMREVFEFLEVDPDFDDPGFDEERHVSSEKRGPTPLARGLARLPGGNELRRVLPGVLEQPLEVPRLPEDLRDRLREHFRPDVEALRRQTGLAFRAWQV